MGILPCIYISVPCACLVPLLGSEEGVGGPGTGLRAGSESPCGYWDVAPSLLQEQVFCSIKSALQPPSFYLKL